MGNEAEREFWIKMSVLEVRSQARFADLAYRNINPKAMRSTMATFSSIHSFLSHCAMISKMLKAVDRNIPDNRVSRFIDKILIKIGIRRKIISIGQVLDVPNSSIIHNRKFRNHLEHYDDRLKRWIRRRGTGVNLGIQNIGPKTAIQATNMVYVSNYDPNTDTFTFVDKDFNLSILSLEAQRIGKISDTWVKRNISPYI